MIIKTKKKVPNLFFNLKSNSRQKIETEKGYYIHKKFHLYNEM